MVYNSTGKRSPYYTHGSYYGSSSDPMLPLLPFMELFYIPPLINPNESVENAYRPAFSAIFSASDQVNTSYFQNPSERASNYAFCVTNTYGVCSVIVWRSHSTTDYTISAYKLQITNGACHNAFVSENFTTLLNNAWGPLIEDYYQCTMNETDAFFTALGVATGTAGFIAPMATIAMMYLAITISIVLSDHRSRRQAKIEAQPANALAVVDVEDDALLGSKDSPEVTEDEPADDIEGGNIGTPNKKKKKNKSEGDAEGLEMGPTLTNGEGRKKASRAKGPPARRLAEARLQEQEQEQTKAVAQPPPPPPPLSNLSFVPVLWPLPPLWGDGEVIPPPPQTPAKPEESE